MLLAATKSIAPLLILPMPFLSPIWEAQAKLARLTERERERDVLLAIRRGLSNKEVASSRGISPRTVEIHRASAIRRLGVSNTIGAVSLIIEAEHLHPLSNAA